MTVDLVNKIFSLAKSNSSAIKIISSVIPFDKDIVLQDIAVIPNQEEEIFIKNKNYLPLFRIGLSFLTIRKDQPVICRKGLIKMFSFNEKLLEINNVDEYSKAVTQILLKPCAQSISRGNSLEIYKTIKINGYNTQIAYLNSHDSWIIGTRNYSCIIRNKEDLEYLNDKKFIINYS